MNPVFTARRRAEEFNSMVESTAELTDTRYADKLAPFVGVVSSLRTAPAAQARPEFVADLRTRLMLAAEAALRPDTATQAALRAPTPRRTGKERRLAVAVGGFAIVSASASMAVAAQSSLPGDTLYPLKRAMENVHESVLRDADAKGTTMLGNASSRLDEVAELSRSSDQDPEVIAQTLDDFASQAVEASDVLLDDYAETGHASSIEELQTFATESLDVLERLEGLVPVEARSSLIEAAHVLEQIQREAGAACLVCTDLPVTQSAFDAVDSLGPIFEALLEQPLEAAAPPARPTREAPTDGSKGTAPSADPVEVDPPSDDGTAVEENLPPTLPSGSDPGPAPAPAPAPSDDGNVVRELTTGVGNADDVGELLTGTTDTVADAAADAVADDLLGSDTK